MKYNPNNLTYDTPTTEGHTISVLPSQWLPEWQCGKCDLWGKYTVHPDDYPCERIPALKRRTASTRKCNTRCQTATGPSCDCSCAGYNHGDLT